MCDRNVAVRCGWTNNYYIAYEMSADKDTLGLSRVKHVGPTIPYV